jgi:hypothetical protein
MGCSLNIFHGSEAVTELCSSYYYYLNLDILMYKQKYQFFAQDVFALIYSITEEGITFILRNLKFIEALFSANCVHYVALLVIM